MQAKRVPITFGKLAGMWFAALTVVTLAAACMWIVVTVRAGSSPMAGEWVGMCQDGKPLVMVTLRPAVGGYGGTISIGNVKVTSPPGATIGTCTAKDPASAEHAMKIAKAWMVDKTLTFDSENGQEYEMRPTGSDAAELRFVATNRDESWFALRRVK